MIVTVKVARNKQTNNNKYYVNSKDFKNIQRIPGVIAGIKTNESTAVTNKKSLDFDLGSHPYCSSEHGRLL